MPFPLRVVLLFTFSVLFLAPAHAQVRLSSEEAEKLLLERSEAIYPPIAAAARAEGIVKVETTVSVEGVVIAARAMSGHPLLQSAAVKAVRNYRYKPHTVSNESVAFMTDVYVAFPSDILSGAKRDEYERQEKLARQYFDQRDRCRDLFQSQTWIEAEESCKILVGLADQLSDKRAMQRIGAYELFGHVLSGQKRYAEALNYYNRALAAGRSTLTESNAELGRLYGHLAMAQHLLGNLNEALESYRKAEKIYQLAHATIGNDDSDDWVVSRKREYMKSLKLLLGYHLEAAVGAGATNEVEEIKKLMKTVQ